MGTQHSKITAGEDFVGDQLQMQDVYEHESHSRSAVQGCGVPLAAVVLFLNAGKSNDVLNLLTQNIPLHSITYLRLEFGQDVWEMSRVSAPILLNALSRMPALERLDFVSFHDERVFRYLFLDIGEYLKKNNPGLFSVLKVLELRYNNRSFDITNDMPKIWITNSLPQLRALVVSSSDVGSRPNVALDPHRHRSLVLRTMALGSGALAEAFLSLEPSKGALNLPLRMVDLDVNLAMSSQRWSVRDVLEQLRSHVLTLTHVRIDLRANGRTPVVRDAERLGEITDFLVQCSNVRSVTLCNTSAWLPGALNALDSANARLRELRVEMQHSGSTVRTAIALLKGRIDNAEGSALGSLRKLTVAVRVSAEMMASDSLWEQAREMLKAPLESTCRARRVGLVATRVLFEPLV